jgi:redox-sensitive bicupin YhaK (pirin superfamily)
MKIINRDTLERTGFAGIRENRIVTDSRLFGTAKKRDASEGLGQFVYLADANYNPGGQSGMHPHSEIDVISIILEGRVSHEGSLEHGRNLVAGDVQVQRAGGEGFNHNEINPDTEINRMIQVWALPEISGELASYKFYKPEAGVTRIYGGEGSQSVTFASRTIIEIIKLEKGESLVLKGRSMSYVTSGNAEFEEEGFIESVSDGDLVNSRNAIVKASNNLHMVVVSQK